MKDVLQPFLAILRAKGLFRKNGQTLVEYALVLAVMSVVLLGASMFVTDRIQLLFSIISDILDTAKTDE